MREDLSNEKVCMIEDCEWRVTFNSSSTEEGHESCCMLLYYTYVSMSFKLEFPCSINKDEYETLLVRLISAL